MSLDLQAVFAQFKKPTSDVRRTLPTESEKPRADSAIRRGRHALRTTFPSVHTVSEVGGVTNFRLVPEVCLAQREACAAHQLHVKGVVFSKEQLEAVCRAMSILDGTGGGIAP